MSRAVHNPHDEVPLRITADAVRVLRGATMEAARIASVEASKTSGAFRRVKERMAATYRGLGEELARAFDGEDVVVGRSLGDHRRADFAADLDELRRRAGGA